MCPIKRQGTLSFFPQLSLSLSATPSEKCSASLCLKLKGATDRTVSNLTNFNEFTNYQKKSSCNRCMQWNKCLLHTLFSKGCKRQYCLVTTVLPHAISECKLCLFLLFSLPHLHSYSQVYNRTLVPPAGQSI